MTEVVPGDTVPGDTVPGDTVPGDTVPGGTVAGFDDTGFDDSNTDVSEWWWVAGVVVAVAAVGGVVVAVRLRDSTERWAQRASLLCDSARAMTVTLSTRLADPSSWSIPNRYAEQHQRCAGYITELTDSIPDPKAGALLAAVATDSQSLHAALNSVALGEPVEVARNLLQPHLDQLASSLTMLEELATARAMNAALPSSRAAN
ncbi:MAG TPA: hypothetical protein VES40_21170 [Ilumatobacteraceae bacterium]|nr:hypothetical protein [Ilumatobacteraceae bacterium]